MKTFEVTMRDSVGFLVVFHIEGTNRATLEHGLNATLGVAGCDFIKIEKYVEVNL